MPKFVSGTMRTLIPKSPSLSVESKKCWKQENGTTQRVERRQRELINFESNRPPYPWWPSLLSHDQRLGQNCGVLRLIVSGVRQDIVAAGTGIRD
jgi:hypothetical protein